MAFLQCKIQHGIAAVIHNFPATESLKSGLTFETGDVSVPGSPPDNPWAVVPGSGVGSDLTTAVSATGAVWVMTSTTGMSASDIVGLELDSGDWFYTRITTVDSGTQLTVDRGSPGAAAIGNRVAVVSQLSGSTDFTIVEDFKTPKSSQILNKTDRLLERGVDHGGTKFACDAFNMAAAALIDTDADDGGDAKGTYDVPNKDNENFDFPSAANFETYRAALLARYKEVMQGTGGQGDLIFDVIDAANTQVAMDAITDSRT